MAKLLQTQKETQKISTNVIKGGKDPPLTQTCQQMKKPGFWWTGDFGKDGLRGPLTH